METIIINGKDYRFIFNYKHDDALRGSLNVLTQKKYHFDFESMLGLMLWLSHLLTLITLCIVQVGYR